MKKDPKVSTEDREAQTSALYAKLGKIAVQSEHLNFAMFNCCRLMLEVKRLPQDYAQTVLIGHNFESMRRTWEALMKLHYAGDTDAIGMIQHVVDRLDNINKRRNNNVHRVWFIGWGNEETASYEVADSIKGVRDIGKNGKGGVKYTDKDSKDFDEVLAEIEALWKIVQKFMACVGMQVLDPNSGKPVKNFHYDKDDKLVDTPPP